MTENGHNPMKPYLGKLVAVKDLATEIKLLRVELLNGGSQAFSAYQPGQFAFVSAFGFGEAPFGIANTPQRGPYLDFAVNRLGSVTTGLHELGEGDMVGVRGPLGNWFPMHQFKGKNLIVLGGGIGGAPLRPVIQSVLDKRADYGHLTILWAARNPSLLVFTDEYDEWRAAPDTTLHLTVDQADEKWDRNVGLITQLLEKVAPSPENAITITCGPPIMIYYVTRLLEKMGFAAKNNYVTLEARMHCGMGKCGRCNLGAKLICVDGPVFNMAEVGELMETFL
ncbi:MAG: FAD/NAD(P)-binding protein [Anaerolineales bacterium]|nr:FAD/NAD(P)-binding protein [Anaerolineales bacterium]MDP3184056.1 FAD/NAD(P)-binding protein [Anaerolineales bacterium]